MFGRILAFVPVKRGVKTHLQDSTNGLLIDTANESTIMADLQRVIY